MSDMEWLAQINTVTNEELLEELDNCGHDFYYNDIYYAIIEEIKRRLEGNDMGVKDNAIGLFEEQRVLTDDEMQAYKDMLRKKEKNMGIYVKGNPKEGNYKLIKTTDGFVLEGKDIAYVCVEIDDELFKKAENAYVLQQIRNR